MSAAPSTKAPSTKATSTTVTSRRLRGLVLIVAGLAVVLLVGDDRPLPFLWLPLVTGTGYLVAAAVGGRDGDLWGPGLVVSGFGLGAVLTVDGPLGGALFSPVVLTTVGAGAVLAMLLPRVGIPVSGLSVASAVLLSGLFFLASERGAVEVFRSPLVYGALLALWGAWELRPASGSGTPSDSATASREPITP